MIDVEQLEHDTLLTVESAAKGFVERAGVRWNGFMRTVVRTWARERMELWCELPTERALWLVRAYVLSVLLPEEQRNLATMEQIRWNMHRWGSLQVTCSPAFGRWLGGIGV